MSDFSDHEIALYQQYIYDCEMSGSSSHRLTRQQHKRLELWKSTHSVSGKRRKTKAPVKKKTMSSRKTQAPKREASARSKKNGPVKRARDQDEEPASPSKRVKKDTRKRTPTAGVEEEPTVPASTFSFPLKILPHELLILDDKLLGEGRMGRVITAKYGNVLVACKTRRSNQARIPFERRLARELEFAASLSVCRSINQYVGVMSCRSSEIVTDKKKYRRDPQAIEHFAVQRYYKHGDLMEYVDNKGGWMHPLEVAQIGINLFSAITDAHDLGIGIVDIKSENVLVDNAGSAVLTDFGSCIRMNDATKIDLDKAPEGVYWTEVVAAPEMIGEREFWLASDVFMGMLIIAELIMSPMRNAEVQKNVLRRHRKNGSVSFQPSEIPPPFHAFRPILEKGFHNNPADRPAAAKILQFLEDMRQCSFKVRIQQMRLTQRYDSLPSPQAAEELDSDESMDDERSPLSSASSTPPRSRVFSDLSWEDLTVGEVEKTQERIDDKDGSRKEQHENSDDEYFDARTSSFASTEDGAIPCTSSRADMNEFISPFPNRPRDLRNIQKYRSSRKKLE